MPPQPLTPVERRRRTIDNLTTIGEAIRRYTAANRMFFASSIRDAGRRPLLSWRVELLPYLGHQELHRQFRLNEPWDSPHNKALLDRIPDVYLSPERCDDTTNYVVPVASFTAFGDKRGGLPLRKFEDGLANTVVLLEVNDASAVPWTKPADLELNMLTLGRHVGGLREDGYFVVWGDGSVGRIAAVTDSMAMFTYDAGEHFLAAEVSLAATAEPATEEGRETVGSDVPSDVPPDPTQGAAAREKPMVAGNSDTLAPSHVPSVLRDRMPLPDPLSLKTARDLVREIYQHDYESAKTDRDRAQLADRLLQRAEQVSGDHAGQYVLLEIAMNIATQVGHGTTALSALQKLVNRYQVDELTVSSDVLTQLAKSDRSRTGVTAVLDRCERLVDMALRQDHFDMAENLCQLALGAARQLDDRQKMANLAERRKEIDEARDAYQTVQQALVSVTNADDPATCLEAGRYYCFVKANWEIGLPLLAKGSDPRLRELAEAELRLPTIAAEQLQLGDGWWELGERDKAHRKALLTRAAHWYAQAVKTLPSGLFRVKAEMRVQQVKREYGQDAAGSAVSGRAG
ncbi:MAG: DUF1559 domain-containing protein [Planctomycetes bacterium]|nr:DUF1559 domain-containing protein [Planctomycetota bacterium]